jgi:hypothetical protein
MSLLELVQELQWLCNFFKVLMTELNSSEEL